VKLTKITEKGRTGNFDVGKSEILICSWNNGTNPDFYAFDNSKIVRLVDEEYFAKAIVGENYKKIEQVLPYKVHHYRITKSKNGNIYFCTYQESTVYGFDILGNSILTWNMEIGEGHPIYDIKFQEPDFLWLAFPTGQTVTQVNLTDKQEVFRIGEYSWDDNCEPLSYPESVFIRDNNLFIPNMGNCKLFKVDILTKKMDLVATFQEKIWQYEETEIGTFIVTDTGIFELKKDRN
jgi:hypothetical protein